MVHFKWKDVFTACESKDVFVSQIGIDFFLLGNGLELKRNGERKVQTAFYILQRCRLQMNI